MPFTRSARSASARSPSASESRRARSAITRRLGLLGAGAKRSEDPHRLYGEADIAHLKEVLRLRDLLGLSLESIVDLAQAEEARAALRDEWENDPSDEDRLRIIENGGADHREAARAGVGAPEDARELRARPGGRLRQIDEIRGEAQGQGRARSRENLGLTARVRSADALERRLTVPYACAVPTCERCGREIPTRRASATAAERNSRRRRP